MNYKDAVIRIECTGSDILPLDAMEEFQGGLKNRTHKDIEKITVEITLDATDIVYIQQEAKRLGLTGPDVGGWIPGPKERILSQLYGATKERHNDGKAVD